jgi:hypothetical protein
MRLGDFGWDWDCFTLIGLGFKVRSFNQFIMDYLPVYLNMSRSGRIKIHASN